MDAWEINVECAVIIVGLIDLIILEIEIVAMVIRVDVTSKMIVITQNVVIAAMVIKADAIALEKWTWSPESMIVLNQMIGINWSSLVILDLNMMLRSSPRSTTL